MWLSINHYIHFFHTYHKGSWTNLNIPTHEHFVRCFFFPIDSAENISVMYICTQCIHGIDYDITIVTLQIGFYNFSWADRLLSTPLATLRIDYARCLKCTPKTIVMVIKRLHIIGKLHKGKSNAETILNQIFWQSIFSHAWWNQSRMSCSVIESSGTAFKDCQVRDSM